MNIKFSHITSVFLVIVLTVGLVVWVKKGTKNDESIVIPVIYPVTVDALQKIGKGIDTIFKENNIKIREFSAEGDSARFSTVVDASLSSSPPLVITIGTQISNTIFGKKYLTKRPPIVAAAIFDSNKLKLPEKLIASVISDNPPSTRLAIEFIVKALDIPVNKIGILANKNEKNSIASALVAEIAFKKLGASIQYGYLSSSTDIVPVTKSLLSKGVDLIIIPHDKVAVANASAVVKAANNNNPAIPVFSLDDGTVEKHGVLFGVSADYEAIGEAAAKEALKIIHDNKKGIDFIIPENMKIVINKNTANILGINFPNNLSNDKFRIVAVGD